MRVEIYLFLNTLVDIKLYISRIIFLLDFNLLFSYYMTNKFKFVHEHLFMTIFINIVYFFLSNSSINFIIMIDEIYTISF